MPIFAYLRVSTNQQDVANQRHGIYEYANTHQLGPLHFVEDTASGQLRWRERRIGQLLINTAQRGDVVVFAEISRWRAPRFKCWRC